MNNSQQIAKHLGDITSKSVKLSNKLATENTPKVIKLLGAFSIWLDKKLAS